MVTVPFCVASALGALGRRFESCRPDSLNPSHTSELPRLAFLLENYDGIFIRQKSVKLNLIFILNPLKAIFYIGYFHLLHAQIEISFAL